jgi:hypothetical protein
MVVRASSFIGETSFVVNTSLGGSKTATLDKVYQAGTYLVEYKAADSNLEIYLGSALGEQVGYSANGSSLITATGEFLYVTTVNADTNNLLTFTLKSISSLQSKNDAVWAPPTITDITPSGLPNIDNTTTITGTNFATNVDVKFRKSDDSTLVTPKSTVRGSATSIIATRPDSFSPTDAPYDVIVTNPSTGLVASSLNAITSGSTPVWVTSTTLNTIIPGTAFSQTIQATDSDGGSTITYAIVSGSLPSGITLNTSSGLISGTTSVTGTFTVTVSATDSGSNTANRTFNGNVENPVVSVQYLIIGGGGSGDKQGGGGAGGVLMGTADFALSTPHTLKIGSGGSGGFNSSTKGTDSQFSNLIAYAGGVGGGTSALKAGGSGAGAHNGAPGNGLPGPGTPVSGQGHTGGVGPTYGANGGGGGAGAAGSSNQGGAGVYSSITGSNIIYAGGGGGGQGDQNGGGGPGGAGGGGHGGGWGYASWPGPTSGSQYGAGGGGQGYAQDAGFTGGNGYQGFIVLKYPDSRTLTGSGITSTTSSSGGFKITQITAGNGTVSIS